MFSRLVAGLCLLMVVLVLHGTVSAGHLTGTLQFVPATGAGGGFDAAEPPDTPLLQPRGSVRSVLTEARSLVAPPGRSFDQEPSSALPPIATSMVCARTIGGLRPIAWEQPRPSASRTFSARAPPTIV